MACISAFLTTQGQTAGNRSSQGNSNKEGFGVISGALHDKTSGEHIEYGNVLLFKSSDSSMLTGTISGAKGKFILEKIPAGKYYVKIQFIGYENHVIPNLIVSVANSDIKLGDINLQPKISSLSAVEITADKAMITNNLDKRVIAVDKNMAVGGGTAADVMENVPSVAVDADGNISLRGNSNITLLIDGKPSSQTGVAATDVLSQIPASAIESVEVITNPSVRYDPDGTSGIINIVLKKKALQGFNGMVSANAGTGEKYNGTLNLNFRQEKFNLFAGADIRRNKMTSLMESTRESTYSDVFTRLKQSQKGTMNRDMFSVNGGVDYMMDTRNTITLSVQHRQMEFGSDGTLLNSNYSGSDSLLRYFERYSFNKRKVNSTDYTVSYKHLFPQKGREFTNDIIFSANEMNNGSDINQQDFTHQGGESIGEATKQKNDAINDNKSFTLQGNYIYPMLKGGRIEAGYKAAIRDMAMTYNYSNFNTISGTWETQESLKNQYDYTDQLYALYGIYGNSLGKLKYQTGLRFEQVWTVSRVQQTGKDYNSDYSSFYPSLHTQYDLGKNRELQFSYSRRVERPSPREMNPYIDYSDSLNIETGNPALKPEFTNSLELGMEKYWDNSSATLTAFFRNTNNVVEDISKIQGNGVTLTMPMNVNHGTSYGLELVGSTAFEKWLRINANFSFFRDIMSAIPEENIERSERFSWTTRLNVTFVPWKDGSMQLIGNYSSPTRSVQEYHKAQAFADASFRQDFLKNKLTFTLRLTDIFNSRVWYENTYGVGFSSESKRHRESRVLYAGLQFKINNYNKKSAKDPLNGEEPDGF